MATSPVISRRNARTLAELISPTERQSEFFQKLVDFDFVLYEGEASGGKSYGLRWWLVNFLVDAYESLGLRDVVVGLFCEDYPTLKDRHISKIRVEMPPSLGTLSKRDGALDFVLRPEYGGGVVALRNLDDPSKYFSAEFAAIAVEELTRHPLSVFNDLRFRLRWPGIERPKFGAGTNPGGIGHEWVKKYWVTKKYPPEFKGVDERTGQTYDITKQFARVTAKASDNPYLPAGYHLRNLTLPPDMARMVARGDWEVYTGQFFPQFEEHRHVVAHAEILKRIKPWHTKWLSGDWGYQHPHAVYKHAQDEHGKVRTYGELWDHRVSEMELGQRINDFCRGEKFSAFAFSWDAGKLSPRSQPNVPKSMMQLLTDSLGSGVPKPYPADSSPGTRISGARLMSQLLDADMWEISDACPKLIGCLPTLIRDEDKPEDVLKVDFTTNEIGDDPYDGARMGLQHMLQTPMVPVTLVAERRVAAYAESIGKEVEELDINTTAQLHRRALTQETRKRKQRRGGLGRIWRPPSGGGA